MKKKILTVLISLVMSQQAFAAWQCGAVSGQGAWSDSGVFYSKNQAKQDALQRCNWNRNYGEAYCVINYCNWL